MTKLRHLRRVKMDIVRMRSDWKRAMSEGLLMRIRFVCLIKFERVRMLDVGFWGWIRWRVLTEAVTREVRR